MRRNDKYRVLAVIRPRAENDLDGGSSTVDRRLAQAACRGENGRSGKKRRGGAK